MSAGSLRKIRERWRGTRGGFYVYVVEGNTLVHISEYAIRKVQVNDEIIYEVPEEKLSGKTLYYFDFSRTGGAFFYKYKDLHELKGLKFKITNPALGKLVSEFFSLFVQMIQQVKDYERALNFRILFAGHAERVKEAYEDPELYYYTFMSMPSDKSRIMSLKVVRRWINELWVLTLALKSLQATRIIYHTSSYGESYWHVEQGSEPSTGMAETPWGPVTFWVEFQPSVMARLMGMFVGRRALVRPDIVIVKGYFEMTWDFLKSGKNIDIIIECKEDPFKKWRGDINKQILQYLNMFKPKLYILTSLYPVPDDAKKALEKRGIKVVDNLRPGNTASITLLGDLIVNAMRLGP